MCSHQQDLGYKGFIANIIICEKSFCPVMVFPAPPYSLVCKNSQIKYGRAIKLNLSLPVLARRHSGFTFEIAAEERGIGEVQFFGNLQDGLVGLFEQHFCLGDHRLGNPCGWRLSACLADERAQIVRCKAKFPGIESGIPVLVEMLAHQGNKTPVQLLFSSWKRSR